MPKRVDRDEQRRQIGGALLELVAEQGVEGVSVRTVAARSGRSPGAVQKYFGTREEMLVLAVELAGERIQHRMGEVDFTAPPRDALRALVLTTLPVDAERRAEAAAQLAFAVQAAYHPRLAAVRQRVDAEVRDALADWLARLPGALAAPAVRADAVIALSDGLALRMLYAPHERPELLAALDLALEALLPGECGD